jgi:hypothetical protein
MHNDSLINWRLMAALLCGFGLMAGVFAFRAQADQWDKKTILTVNQPIQIEEHVLQPGTYVMKLLDSPSDRHIVQIFNRDQNHLIGTVLAINDYHVQPVGHTQFTFWETPVGTARAMRDWFYPGDNYGQQFRYPKHLTVLETARVNTPATELQTAATQPETGVAPPSVETPAPEPSVAQEPQANREEQRVEIAQNNPPPAPPQETPAAPPAQLPKTASIYPLAGLAGLFSLGIYGLLRRIPA